MAELTTAKLKQVIAILRRQPKLTGIVSYHADHDMGIRYYLRRFRSEHPHAQIVQYLQGSRLQEFGFHPGACTFFYSEEEGPDG